MKQKVIFTVIITLLIFQIGVLLFNSGTPWLGILIILIGIIVPLCVYKKAKEEEGEDNDFF